MVGYFEADGKGDVPTPRDPLALTKDFLMSSVMAPFSRVLVSEVENNNPSVKTVVCSPDLTVFSYTATPKDGRHPPPAPAATPVNPETKSYQCTFCQKTFQQKNTYQNHLRTHSREGDDPYRCNICGKTFAVPARLTRHFRTHTGEKPYQCEYCNKSFSVKENLSVHRRIHTKERPYKCDICERAFEHSGKLHRHMRIHTGERPHKCNICNKTFIQSGQLVIHMRTHTGEKPYVCKVCQKGFTCSKQLKVHTRTHTGEKPYACDICGKSFGYNHVLKLHQVAHYGEKVYKCTICNETFTSKKTMEVHIKSHSGHSGDHGNHAQRSAPVEPVSDMETSQTPSSVSSLSGPELSEESSDHHRPAPVASESTSESEEGSLAVGRATLPSVAAAFPTLPPTPPSGDRSPYSRSSSPVLTTQTRNMCYYIPPGFYPNTTPLSYYPPPAALLPCPTPKGRQDPLSPPVVTEPAVYLCPEPLGSMQRSRLSYSPPTGSLLPSYLEDSFPLSLTKNKSYSPPPSPFKSPPTPPSSNPSPEPLHTSISEELQSSLHETQSSLPPKKRSKMIIQRWEESEAISSSRMSHCSVIQYAERGFNRSQQNAVC